MPAPSRITPHKTASCEFRISSSLVAGTGRTEVRPSESSVGRNFSSGAPYLAINFGSASAPIRSTPVRIPASSAGSAARRSPFCNTTIASRPSDRAADGADAARDGRASEHHGGDRRELVAGARVGLGLSQVGDVDDSGQPGGQPGQHVQFGQPIGDFDAGVPRGLGIPADRVVRAPARRAMEQHGAAQRRPAAAAGAWRGRPRDSPARATETTRAGPCSCPRRR